MKKTSRVPHKAEAVSVAVLDEMMRLYNGWLSYLLRRLGEQEIRVESEELKAALETLSCRVEREGSGYVIRMCDPEGGEVHGGE